MTGRGWCCVLLGAALFVAGAPAVAAAATPSAQVAAAAAAAQLPAVFRTKGFPFAVATETLIAVPQGPVVRLDELVVGQSQSPRPLPHIALPLPQGARGVRWEGGVGRADFRVAGPTVSLGPVGPHATVRVAFSYVLPATGGLVWLPVRYPTVYLFVLVPHGQWRVAAAGFAFRGVDRLGPLDLDVYATDAPTPGAELPLRLLPPVWPWRDGSLGLLSAAMTAVAWWRLRRRKGRVGGPSAPCFGASADAVGAMPGE